MREHTKQHTTPPKRLYTAILHQYRPSPTRGCQHPPRVAWGHPGTRATQGIAGTSRPGIHGRAGTPETGVPRGSKHTRQHTSPVLCAGTQHTNVAPGLDQYRSLLLEPMVSALTGQALRHKARARSLPVPKWRKKAGSS